jgi:hypothetical protein
LMILSRAIWLLLFSLLICKTDVSSTGSQLYESSEQSLSRVWLDWYVPRMLDLLHRMQVNEA